MSNRHQVVSLGGNAPKPSNSREKVSTTSALVERKVKKAGARVVSAAGEGTENDKWRAMASSSVPIQTKRSQSSSRRPVNARHE